MGVLRVGGHFVRLALLNNAYACRGQMASLGRVSAFFRRVISDCHPGRGPAK